MPIYVFKCPVCGHVMEVLASKDAAPLCPKCASQDLDPARVTMEKQVTAAAFHLKGPGWARDGYTGGER